MKKNGRPAIAPDIDRTLRILVVDDDEISRRAIINAIQQSTLETKVEEATNGRDGLNLLLGDSFDCVILDHKMPQKNGMAVLKEAREAGIKSPIIMLTGSGNERLATDLMKAGATDYLSKADLSSESLSNAIRDGIAFREAEIRAEQSEKLEKLRLSESYFRLLIENALEMITVLDDEGMISYQSLSVEKVLGYSREELIGRKPEEIIHAEDAARAGKILNNIYTNLGSTESVKLRFQHKDGSWITLESVIKSIVDATDTLSVVINSRDITSREEAVEALRQSEKQVRLLLDSTAEAIYGLDLEGNCTFANPACLRMLGYRDLKDILGKNMHELIHHTLPDGSPLPNNECKIYLAFRAGEGTHVTDEDLWRADGSSFPAEYWSYPASQGSEVVGCVVTFVDITERKQAEEALRESESLFSGVLRIAQEAIISINEDREIIIFNKGAENIFGYAADEVVGQAVEMLIPDSLRDEHRGSVEAFGQDYRSSRTMGLNRGITGLRKSGKEFPARATISRLKLGDKTILTVVLRDVTEEMKAQEQKQLYSDIVQNMQTGLSVWHLEEPDDVSTFKLLATNPAAAEATGSTVEDLVGQYIFTIFPGLKKTEIPQSYAEIIHSGKTGDLGEVEYGDDRVGTAVFEVKAFPLPGNCVGVTFDNISESKSLEAQLAVSQKMEAIGQLAAGIAHEINTPIQYVGDNLLFLRDAFQDLQTLSNDHSDLLEALKKEQIAGDLVIQSEAVAKSVDLEYLTQEIPGAIEQSLEGVERVAHIVRAMKDFSHPGEEAKKPADINKAIESTVIVARNEWKYVAELNTDLDRALPLVPSLVSDLNQVILNLIINAAHAIDDVVKDNPTVKGTITISTRQVDEEVEIRLADTGSGIPKEIRSRIFEPFFTTKTVGKGTGQGLAYVHAVIVDKHQGNITVESELGKGTTFIIRLPLQVAET